MEYSIYEKGYILQPNEVLECGQLRITNIGQERQSVSDDLLRSFDLLRLTSGPHVERGLEFRLRV